MIKFAVLDPRPTALEQVTQALQSAKDDGFRIIGIEVTVPPIAALCEENIDPQHDGSEGRSAILEVYKQGNYAGFEDIFGYHGHRNKVLLVTVRADLDAIGAMALLQSWDLPDGQTVTKADGNLTHRVKQVDAADCAANGEWKPFDYLSQGFGYDSDPGMAAVARAVADFKISIETRVEWAREWLENGLFPPTYMCQFQEEREQVKTALESGQTTVEVVDGVAIVNSSLRSATAIGYSKAPIVIALNEKFPFEGETVRKFTVCQYSQGYLDMSQVKEQLNALEPGWGGSNTIIGSPQGVSSSLTVEQVLEAVQTARI